MNNKIDEECTLLELERVMEEIGLIEFFNYKPNFTNTPKETLAKITFDNAIDFYELYNGKINYEKVRERLDWLNQMIQITKKIESFNDYKNLGFAEKVVDIILEQVNRIEEGLMFHDDFPEDVVPLPVYLVELYLELENHLMNMLEEKGYIEKFKK